MILRIYAIRDKAVGAFMQPYFARSDAEALRSFQDAVSDVKSPFHAHAEDYDLYHLGHFDDAAGFVGHLDGGPVAIVTGLALSSRIVQG